MLPFQIKICGVTDIEGAVCACQSGADAVGLNFYQPSPRFVEAETALAIANSVDDFNQEVDSQGGPKVKKIGVFVDMPVPEMASLAWHIGLDGIQLHGEESPRLVDSIREHLEQLGHHCFLIRALKSKPADVQVGDLDQERQRVLHEIDQWMEKEIDLVLLDAAVPGEYGGTGKVIDLSTIPPLGPDAPIVLAGGLTPRNVADAILNSGFRSVDVASGVESAPGVKDQQKVNAFVDAAQTAFASL